MLPASSAGAAARVGDRPALRTRGRTGTFGELHSLSDRAASALALEEGAVAALTMPSGVDYVVAYLAVAKLGAIASGINPRLSTGERQRVLSRLQPDVMVDELRLADGCPPVLPRDPDRVVTIVFTSGTSGAPKGAVFTNRQLEAITTIDAGGLDVWGTGGPMLGGTQFCHVGFMTKLQWCLRLGCTLLVQERWRADVALRL